MTNIEMLCWGIQHIAKNHGFDASTDYKEDGEVCIYGGCNVPTLGDVQQLCLDLGIDTSECLESGDCGIDVFITDEWMKNIGRKPYKKGLELWKRIS
jgi:hypothetical protein